MLDLALQDPDRYVTIAEIGGRRHLSASYLEQLFGKLRKAGIIEGIRGPSGGYRLARPAAEITVDQILDAVDSTLKTNSCQNHRPNCDQEGECITFELWDSLNQAMRNFLSAISLKDLADRKIRKDNGIHTVSFFTCSSRRIPDKTTSKIKSGVPS
ncbi:MAG: Rrf2 family transcriptional regulator, partial [Burkholderiales bacterium]|nr:Rrf2 family transcriptional regulator [Burkholderiales bacterium]